MVSTLRLTLSSPIGRGNGLKIRTVRVRISGGGYVDLVELGRHAALRRLFQKWSEGSIPSFDIKQERDHWRGQVAVNHPFLTLGVRLPLLALMPSKKILTEIDQDALVV